MELRNILYGEEVFRVQARRTSFDEEREALSQLAFWMFVPEPNG